MTRDHKSARNVLLALGIGMMLVAGCDFTEGFDVDPNLATEAAPDLIIPAAQLALVQVAEGDFARVSSLWAGQYVGADRQYSSIQTGSASSEDFNNTWNTAYADGLAQFRLAFQGYQAGGNRVGMGVARVHEALLWGIVAALFGDIPFSQALQPDEFPTPAFDSQAAVYAGTQQMLDQAIEDLESNVGTFPSRNIFELDRAQYIRAAYTVKARHYLHVGDYANARAAALQGLQIGDDIIAPHGTAYGSWNNWFAFTWWFRYGYLNANNSHAAHMLFPGTTHSRDNLKTDESARRAYFFTGSAPANADITTGIVTGGIAGQAEPFPILTYIENQLILAEATLLLNSSSPAAQQEALDALNDVRAWNRTRWSGGQYDDYLLADFLPGGIANPQAESTPRALLREILEEKYIALMGGIEPFNDIRRTENYIGVNIPQQDRVPQRFLYAQNEINANPNVPSPIPGVYTETPVNASFNYTAAAP